MRYRENGEVHKDFHLTTDTTIRWVLDTYGEEFLAELFRRTAQNVYADIYTHLKAGDASELIEHMKYFLEREGGAFSVSEDAQSVRFQITDCPAARHIKQRYGNVPESFHQQTILMNKAWSEDTPFDISTDVRGECGCVIELRRKTDAAK